MLFKEPSVIVKWGQEAEGPTYVLAPKLKKNYEKESRCQLLDVMMMSATNLQQGEIEDEPCMAKFRELPSKDRHWETRNMNETAKVTKTNETGTNGKGQR